MLRSPDESASNEERSTGRLVVMEVGSIVHFISFYIERPEESIKIRMEIYVETMLHRRFSTSLDGRGAIFVVGGST